MTVDTRIDTLLIGVTVPDTGLVVWATWDDTDGPWTLDERHAIITAAEDQEYLRWSGDGDGHYAAVSQVSESAWVAIHCEERADATEYVIFRSFADAYAHYDQVVRGQQDATGGKAWRESDVPGVLAGDDFRWARRAGYTYEQAADRYAADPAAAVTVWRTLTALAEPR